MMSIVVAGILNRACSLFNAHSCDCAVQALQPKLEAMEAMWFRLHSISGAETPDDVVSHWEGVTRLQTVNCQACTVMYQLYIEQTAAQSLGIILDQHKPSVV